MVGEILNTRKANRIKLIAVVCGICVITVIIYFPNYAKLKKMRSENKKLINKNTSLANEITEYEDMIKSLRDDPYIYEKIARDDLGIAKENEIVIDID